MPPCPSAAFLLWQDAAGGRWRRILRQPVSVHSLAALWALQVFNPAQVAAAPSAGFVDGFMGS